PRGMLFALKLADERWYANEDSFAHPDRDNLAGPDGAVRCPSINSEESRIFINGEGCPLAPALFNITYGRHGINLTCFPCGVMQCTNLAVISRLASDKITVIGYLMSNLRKARHWRCRRYSLDEVSPCGAQPGGQTFNFDAASKKRSNVPPYFLSTVAIPPR